MTVLALSQDEEWKTRGLCRNDDPDLWYPDPADPPLKRAAKTMRAISICKRCPVWAECLRYAFRIEDDWGIFGGQTKNMRTRTRKRIEERKRMREGR
jgi:WhiB family redox-sensing transcriptional regulator